MALRATGCSPDCNDARVCGQDCSYHRCFAPRVTEGPSGMHDRPRPFVIRAAHLAGWRFSPGVQFNFCLHVFDLQSQTTACLVEAFRRIAGEGMGPTRAKAELLRFELDELSIPLHDAARAHRIRVHFVTPTELKHNGAIMEQPDFRVLISLARARIAGLSTFYAAAIEPVDWPFLQRAEDIRMTRCEIHTVEALRTSTRTGRTHSIGGFVGVVEYEGDLGEFLPWLRAAEFAGIGRHTTFGKGEIRVQIQTPGEC